MGKYDQYRQETQKSDFKYADIVNKYKNPAPKSMGDILTGIGSKIAKPFVETGKQIVNNFQWTMESGSNIIGSELSSMYKWFTGKQIPWYGTAESGFTEKKEQFSIPKNIAQLWASWTWLATQMTPVWLASNLWFNIANEIPYVRGIPRAISAWVEWVANVASDVTGISPDITKNLAVTGLNILFLKSIGKQWAPIEQAYKTGGQTWALKALGASVPKTTLDIAKQPIDLAIWVGKVPFKVADWAIGKTAQKLLTDKTGTKELFQASSPSINKLGNKNLWLDKLREKSAIADETIVKLGYKPKNTTERVQAYQNAMLDVWKQVENLRGGVKQKFSGKQVGDFIRNKIEEAKTNWKLSPSQQKDANTLNDWAAYYDSLWDLDFPQVSGIRWQVNGETTWNKKLDNGDLFNKTFQWLAGVIRKTENKTIDSAKGTKFQDVMNRYWALAEMLEDVLKQDVKAQRAKWEWLTTTYSRIEGISDIAKWVMWRSPKEIASGVGKIAVGKTLAKLKDVDFLIENWYSKLAKSLGIDTNKPITQQKKVYKESEWLTPIQESSNTQPLSGKVKWKMVSSPKQKPK